MFFTVALEIVWRLQKTIINDVGASFFVLRLVIGNLL